MIGTWGRLAQVPEAWPLGEESAPGSTLSLPVQLLLWPEDIQLRT